MVSFRGSLPIIVTIIFFKVVEVLMVVVSLRGSVMDDRPRESMQCLVYIKQGDMNVGKMEMKVTYV